MILHGGVRFIDRPSPVNIRRLDGNALPMISAFHTNGIRVDVPYLRTLEKDFTSRLHSLESSLSTSIGSSYQDFNGKVYHPFSITSPDQVARLLFQHLKVQGTDRLQLTDSEKRETTSDDVLERYRDKHPAVALILDHRELSKLLGTYVLPLQTYARRDPLSRVHTDFSVTTAATGRLASHNPNLTNIPTRSILGKMIRRAFIASPGHLLVSNDLSQIEMRWAAHLAQDSAMSDIFERGLDIHDQTACNIFRRSLDEITSIKKKVKSGTASAAEQATYKYFTQFERLPSKTIGFGVLYGQTAQGLLDSILLSKDPEWSLEERQNFEAYWTLDRCEKLIAEWYEVFSGIKTWMSLQYDRARRWGMVWDAFGRMRLVPEVYSVHKRIKAEGLRKSGNHAVQSSATGTIKVAMASLMTVVKFFHGFGSCMSLLSIHDELLHDVKKEDARDFADAVSEEMETATPISVPIKSSSDFAESWSDLK